MDCNYGKWIKSIILCNLRNLNYVDFDERLDVSKVVGKCVLIICKLDEWKINGVIPDDIVPISLSGNCNDDEFIMQMMTSKKHAEKIQQILYGMETL